MPNCSVNGNARVSYVKPHGAMYNDRTVIQIASMLIVYAALYQFSDAIQVICAGVLLMGDESIAPKSEVPGA